MEQTVEGASVFWTARVQTADDETHLASCRYAGLDGMTFVCEKAFPIGSTVTMFVAALHASVHIHTGWRPFELRVAYRTFVDGLYRMSCEHRGMAEPSLSWLAQALSRLKKQSHPLVAGPAPALPPRLPPSLDAQRQQLRGLLQCSPGAVSLLAHHGTFDAPSLRTLFSTARAAMANTDTTFVQRRKLYASVVELGRNIHHHALCGEGAATDAAARQPLGAIQMLALPLEPGDEAPGYQVSAANRIAAASVEGLRGLMQALRQMDGPARLAAYRDVLFAPPAVRATHPKPGFGLLTLAAESGQALSWSLDTATVEGQVDHFFVVHVCF